MKLSIKINLEISADLPEGYEILFNEHLSDKETEEILLGIGELASEEILESFNKAKSEGEVSEMKIVTTQVELIKGSEII